MNKSTSIFIRGVSLALAFLVSFAGTPGFSTPSSLVSEDMHVSTSLTSLVSEPFSISKKLGRVESFHWGSGKTIFHIQTAHGHYDAQKKIAGILKELEEKQGVKTVLVEGAWEPLYPEILNFFPENPKKTQKLNDLLMRKAVVQGPEFYLLHSKKAQGFGIEDGKAYLQNASDFSDVIKAREASRKFMLAAVDGIEKIASAYLSRELRDFLRQKERFQNGQFALGDWLFELKRQVQVNYSEDLSDLGFEKEWPNLVRFYQIQKNEKLLEESKFNSEKKALLNHLQRVGSLEQIFNFKSLESGLPPEVLMNLLNGLPIDFNFEKYPQVKAFLTTLVFQSEIDVKLFMQEIDSLNHLLAEKMAKNETEKKIVDVYQRKILLSKLLELELAPADYEMVSEPRTTSHEPRSFQAVTGDRDQGLEISNQRIAESVQVKDVDRGPWTVDRFKPSVLLNEIKGLNAEGRVRGVVFEGSGALDEVYSKAMRFYEGAKARDLDMIKNVELAIKELGVKKVAVITGGFHAEPFRDYFVGKSYSYGLIMPAISQIDEEGRQTYLQGMMDQSDFLAKSATIEKIPVTAPSSWKWFRNFLFGTGEKKAALTIKERYFGTSPSLFGDHRFTRRTWFRAAAAVVAGATALSPIYDVFGQEVRPGKTSFKPLNVVREKFDGIVTSYLAELKKTIQNKNYLKVVQSGSAGLFWKNVSAETLSGFQSNADVQIYLIQQLPLELNKVVGGNEVHALIAWWQLLQDESFNRLEGNVQLAIINSIADLMNRYQVPDAEIKQGSFLYLSKMIQGLLKVAPSIRKNRKQNGPLYLALQEAVKAVLTNSISDARQIAALRTLLANADADAIADRKEVVVTERAEIARIIGKIRDPKPELYGNAVSDLEFLWRHLFDYWGNPQPTNPELSIIDDQQIKLILEGMKILVRDAAKPDHPKYSRRGLRDGVIYNIPPILKSIPGVEAGDLLRQIDEFPNPAPNLEPTLRGAIQQQKMLKPRSEVRLRGPESLGLFAPGETKSLRSEVRLYELSDKDKALVKKLNRDRKEKLDFGVLFATDSKLGAQLTHKMAEVPKSTAGWELIAKWLATHPGLKVRFQVMEASVSKANEFVEKLQSLPGPGFSFPKDQISLEIVGSMDAPVAKVDVGQVVTAVSLNDLPEIAGTNLLRVHLDDPDNVPPGILAALMAAIFPDVNDLSFQAVIKASELVTNGFSFNNLWAAVKAFTVSA